MQKLTHFENQESPGYSNRIYPDEEPSQKSPSHFDPTPSSFKVSLQVLIDIVKSSEKRKFSEDIDHIESLGGDFFLVNAVNSDLNRGVSNTPESLQARETEFGNNRKNAREATSFWSLLWDALGDFTLRVLMVCAVISIAVEVGTASEGDRPIAWIDGFAILLAVFVSSTVQAFNDYQKDQQFQVLNQISDDRKKVTVVRDGQILTLNDAELLVGDIVTIAEGMDIPADGLVLDASEVKTDESALTGETEPIDKNTLSDCLLRRNELIAEDVNKEKAGNHALPTPILLSGSKVLQGEGKFMVIVVGANSCEGRILSILESEDEATPLQEKLEGLAGNIGKFGLISAILILLVLCIRFAVIRIQQNDFQRENWNELISYVLIAITVVVVAIPEGLPLSVVISLAYSVKKMLKDNNLVRTLQACETMGGANMICSDKTGTLTQNMMTFTCLWNGQKIDIDTYGSAIQLGSYVPTQLQELFLDAAIVNSSAILRPEIKGSSTEVCLLKFSDKCGITYETLRAQAQVVHRFPFTSSRKRMSLVTRTSDGRQRLVVKGASELVLEACSSFHMFSSNEVVPMDDTMKTACMEAIDSMAKEALRTLVFAYKDLNGSENLTDKDQKGVFAVEKSGLTVICIVGIKDILRKEVPEAVAKCKRAGIKVRMVTGDNKLTARAIAMECKIIEPGNEQSLVLEGADFMAAIGGVVCDNCGTAICDCVHDEKLAKKSGKKVRKDRIQKPEEFNRIYPHIDVLARSRPEDKYALVVGLKEKGHIVAVTGDGTNDAPALKKADVGFAMGICGTQVAREAAAIILLDDNFSSIVKAVLWGRNIFDSIRKFLQFQLTVNVVAVGITLINAAIIKQEVFPPVQMLWINLIMDAFASLALATEPPNENLLDRKPVNRADSMINKKMFKHILGQAIYQFIILLVLIFDGDNFIPEYKDKFDETILKTPGTPWSVKYNEGGYVRSGRYIYVNDPEKSDYQHLEDTYGPSRHFTIVFNTFVWMNIFNFLNARRIKDELNIFEGLSRNPLFFFILVLIIFLQCIIITHGSLAFHVYKWYDDNTGGAGLHPYQWLICVGFGAGSLVVGFLLKFLPEEKCLEFGKKRRDPIHNPSKILEIRRGSTMKMFQPILQQKQSFQKQPSIKATSNSSFKNKQTNNNGVTSKNNIAFVKHEEAKI